MGKEGGGEGLGEAGPPHKHRPESQNQEGPRLDNVISEHWKMEVRRLLSVP